LRTAHVTVELAKAARMVIADILEGYVYANKSIVVLPSAQMTDSLHAPIIQIIDGASFEEIIEANKGA